MILIDPKLATARRSAFTLVEVMVSIAVALLLLLGVNQVFHATALTTGVGLALSTSQQMSRTVKSSLQDDLKNGAWDTGILIIRNEQVYAYRNTADQQSAADPSNPAKPDPALSSAFPGGLYPAYTINSRSHRVDRIAFFARGLFDRQTSPGPMDTTPVQATEAWVWYGHLALPNNAVLKGQTRDDRTNPQQPAQYFGPGAANTGNATNDNNFFASDWTLGRFATLLLGPSNTFSAATLKMNPDYLRFDLSISYATPLSYDSVSAAVSGGSPEFAYKSLHDVAGDSIANFTARLSQDVSATSPAVIPADGIPWYCSMIGIDSQQPPADHRYQASPYIPSVGLDSNNTSRISPTSLALAAPVMARGCCHFIVEYAGNFLTQTDAPGTIDDGTITSGVPSQNSDHIDFVSVYDQNTLQYVRKIRWYGYPRDTNGIPGIQYDDVLPLRDVLALNNAGPPAPFEHFGVGFPNPPSAMVTKGPLVQSNTLVQYNQLGNQPDYAYTCAWGAYPARQPPWPNYGLPKLLRITVVFDDPNGRLGTEQSYEYIIDLRN